MQAWHSLSVAAAGRELGTDTECGLTPQEAAARLERYGPNELGGKEGEPLWRKLLAQFQDYLVIILLAAGAVSFAVGERTDAALILLIVVLNAVLGVIQEGRAERALQALKQLAAPRPGCCGAGACSKCRRRPSYRAMWCSWRPAAWCRATCASPGRPA